MAKKKGPPPPENHERWLVSYADFITLLFATFTALFAISNADKEKFAAMAASLKRAFNSAGMEGAALPGVSFDGGNDVSKPLVLMVTKSPEVSQSPSAKGPEEELEDDLEGSIKLPEGNPDEEGGGTGEGQSMMAAMAQPTPNAAPNASPTPAATPNDASPATARMAPAVPPQPTPAATPPPTPAGTPGPPGGSGEGGASDAMASEIKSMLQEAGLQDQVQVHQEARGTVISLGEAAFFGAGAVEVQPQCVYKLDKIVNVLRNKEFDIRVEGHTDNTPIRSGRFRDNLELSTLRAVNIVNFMIKEYHFPPASLCPAGYGEWRPVADNATEQGRQKNRRVDIVILNKKAESQEPVRPKP